VREVGAQAFSTASFFLKPPVVNGYFRVNRVKKLTKSPQTHALDPVEYCTLGFDGLEPLNESLTKLRLVELRRVFTPATNNGRGSWTRGKFGRELRDSGMYGSEHVL
jgi:hypothetical protein